MKGSRRGDFSRVTFDPAKRYSGVLMQQGRVQLDADWNEQVDIIANRLRSQALDFIGATGAPAGSSGFEIVPRAALRFDGRSQYLTLGHEPSQLYSAAPALSLDLRIKPRSGGAGGAVISRFDRLAEGEPLRFAYMLLVMPDGEVRLKLGGETGRELRGSHRIGFGRWNRLTLSHDRERCHLFVDGRSAGTLDEGIEPHGGSTGAFFLVGLVELEDDERQGFDGYCREISLWSGAWQPGAALAGDPDELLGQWRFDRGGGDVALDRSRHANHALLGGGRAGARPTLELEDLLVSAGRYYADGLLCENEATTRLTSQPDLPGARLPEDRAPGRTYLFYLDAWERFVAPAQEPMLREPALGGADTAARTQTVAQTRWLPIAGEASEPASGVEELQRLVRSASRSGRLQARRPTTSPGTLGNYLYRVEVHRGGGHGWPRRRAAGDVEIEIVAVDSAAKRLQTAGDRDPGETLRSGQWVEVFSAETDRASQPGLLTRVEAVDTGERQVTLKDPIEALTGHDQVRLRPVGLLKWSRANGSVTLPIRHLEPGSATATVGAQGGGALPVKPGDWVEVLDDHLVLRGATPQLLQVASVDETSRAVTLDEATAGDPGTRAELHPFLRVWDGVAPLRVDRWQRLEHGIEVRPVGGHYRRGDAWTFVSRAVSGEIDWPQDDSGQPEIRVAEGGERHFSPLAVLQFHEWGFELSDSRPVFHPLSTGFVSKAGDRMQGPLEIRPEEGAEEAATPMLDVAGTARADTLLGKLGSPAAVETFSLADAAVTRSKISPDVGTVPAGYGILGDSPVPPQGYRYTGCTLVVPNPGPRWVQRAQLPIGEQPGELHSATVGERAFTFSDSGRVWSFDARLGRLEERQPMPEPRRRFSVAAAHGKIYLVGGVDHQDEKVGPTLEYDPETDAWAWRQALPTPRCDLALAVADGKLYAVGGLRDVAFLEVVSRRNETYDPLVDNWESRRPVPTARYAMGAAANGRGLFAFGGRRRWFLRWLGQAVSAVNEEYLPAVDRWTRRPNQLPAPRSEGAAAPIGNSIFVVGGRSLFGWSSDTSSFEPRGDAWESSAPLDAPVVSPGVTSVDGSLVLHSAGSTPGTLETRECRIATTFYVHRKTLDTDGDLEPQIRIPADERRHLAEIERPIHRPPTVAPEAG